MMWDHSFFVVMVFLSLAINIMINDLMMTVETGLKDLLQVFEISLMILLCFCLARTFGDPHLVTLDGHKYTFNGHGEFVLVQSLDESLIIQVRMTEPRTAINQSNQTLAGSGTSISALVARHNESDTVQFELLDDKIAALVNGDEVDFSELSQQEFKNLTVINKDNRTLSAVLTTGVTITVKENNKIFSDVSITLSDNYYRNTHGLLGQYNGKKDDEFLPRNSTTSLPLNSTLEEIHNKFGLTCKYL